MKRCSFCDYKYSCIESMAVEFPYPKCIKPKYRDYENCKIFKILKAKELQRLRSSPESASFPMPY